MKTDLSDFTVDRTNGVVVWRMSPDVAFFYAEEISAIAKGDAGMEEDARNLNRLAEKVNSIEEDT